jgi:hypothetical protein
MSYEDPKDTDLVSDTREEDVFQQGSLLRKPQVMF